MRLQIRSNGSIGNDQSRSCILGCRLRLRESYIDAEDVGIGILCREGDSLDMGTIAAVDDALVGDLDKGALRRPWCWISHMRCY